jgi:hypothetical protein
MAVKASFTYFLAFLATALAFSLIKAPGGRGRQHCNGDGCDDVGLDRRRDFIGNIANAAQLAAQNAIPNTVDQPDFCGKRVLTQGSRIVGGKDAYHGQFPWQVQLLAQVRTDQPHIFQCGASLITDQVILTAAHCMKYTHVDRYKVILGRQELNPELECKELLYDVVQMAIHPQFNKRHLTNDIAILWIKSKYNQTVLYTDYILPICLPDPLKALSNYYSPGKVLSKMSFTLYNYLIILEHRYFWNGLWMGIAQ